MQMKQLLPLSGWTDMYATSVKYPTVNCANAENLTSECSAKDATNSSHHSVNNLSTEAALQVKIKQ